MENVFTLSEHANMNYVATICKITELHPIPKADRLLRTVVNGYDIVVQNTMKEGDIVVYFSVESEINKEFLGANNLFRFDDYTLNANAEEVKDIYMKSLSAETEDEKKAIMAECNALCGFFTNKGRVRCIKLRDCPSQGFVIPVDSLVKFRPELKEITDWGPYVGTVFNEVLGEKFCWKYIVPIKSGTPRANKMAKASKKLERFDKIVPGQFEFHYDTKMLNENMWRFNPDTNVNISVKVHGTSVILAHVLCNRKLSTWEKIKKFFGCKVKTMEYDHLFSSRKVIKNRYVNPDAHDFYGVNIWGEADKLFRDYIPEGMTVYGEIAGYLPGGTTMIQKNHDYGCEPGQWKFMPYRITETDEYGAKTEWDLMKVDTWTHELVEAHPELAEHVLFLTILYNGRFGDLYPEIDESEHWNEEVLNALKNDKSFGMELDEPMCMLHRDEVALLERKIAEAKENNVGKKELKKLTQALEVSKASLAPREGIVVKITGDPIGEAWKLKTQAHYQMETKLLDSGELDMEEAESVAGDDNN